MERAATARVATAVAGLALAVGALAGCSSDGGSEDAFCRQVAAVPSLDTLLTGFGDAVPAELTARLSTAADAYDDLRASAPGEIRSSVGEVVDLVDAVLDAVRDHAEDPEAVADELRSAMADHPGAATAATEVAAYAQERCDVELNPQVEGDPSTTIGGGTEPAAATSTTAG